MPMICICSPQGGSGRTMLAANLASAYANRGNKVLLLDLNEQNALRLHFNLTLDDAHGFIPHAATTPDWGQYIVKVDTNLYLLPYGEASREQREAFQYLLSEKPETVRRSLSGITRHQGLVIIVDMPAGPHAALGALHELIDLHLVTLLADGIAPALLEKIEKRAFLGMPLNKNGQHYFVLNKIDPRYEMNHDIGVYLRQRIGERLLGEIHQDSSVPAALASQKSLRLYRPSSSALFDIDALEQQLSHLLNITVGNNDVLPTL